MEVINQAEIFLMQDIQKKRGLEIPNYLTHMKNSLEEIKKLDSSKEYFKIAEKKIQKSSEELEKNFSNYEEKAFTELFQIIKK